MIRVTAQGRKAQLAGRELLDAVELRWPARFGAETLDAVRTALERIAVGPSGGPSPLLAGIEPYPDGWPAAVPRPETLPHFPMVLHRGGYPDGS